MGFGDSPKSIKISESWVPTFGNFYFSAGGYPLAMPARATLFVFIDVMDFHILEQELTKGDRFI